MTHSAKKSARDPDDDPKEGNPEKCKGDVVHHDRKRCKWPCRLPPECENANTWLSRGRGSGRPRVAAANDGRGAVGRDAHVDFQGNGLISALALFLTLIRSFSAVRGLWEPETEMRPWTRTAKQGRPGRSSAKRWRGPPSMPPRRHRALVSRGLRFEMTCRAPVGSSGRHGLHREAPLTAASTTFTWARGPCAHVASVQLGVPRLLRFSTASGPTKPRPAPPPALRPHPAFPLTETTWEEESCLGNLSETLTHENQAHNRALWADFYYRQKKMVKHQVQEASQ